MYDRLSKIQKLLKTLKAGFDWMEANEDHPDECQALIERAKPIIGELEALGVPPRFSESVLLLGGKVFPSTVRQFEEDT